MNNKPKRVFVQRQDTRIELDSPTSISQQPLPQYTSGSASREHFPETFPIVRKEGAGVGTAASVSTPTFGGSEGNGHEINFFNDKRKFILKSISEILIKSKIYYDPARGEKPPKGIKGQRGPKGGWFYEGVLPGRKWEKGAIKTQSWEKPYDKKISHGGVPFPTTWHDVFINRDPKAKIQVIGTDQKGRNLCLNLIDKNDPESLGAAKKNWRMIEFTKALPTIIKVLDNNKHKSDEALVLKVLYLTGLRVGSEDDPSGKIRSYGISSLLRKHCKVEGDKISIQFEGKDGIKNHAMFIEPDMAKRILACKKDTDEVFKVDYQHVLDYLRRLSPENKFRIHDFRSWNATQTALKAMKKIPRPTTEKEFIKAQREVGKIVGARLFHKYNIAISTYISPDVWIPWKLGIK